MIRIELRAEAIDEAGNRQEIRISVTPSPLSRSGRRVSGGIALYDGDAEFSFEEEGDFNAFPDASPNALVWVPRI